MSFLFILFFLSGNKTSPAVFFLRDIIFLLQTCLMQEQGSRQQDIPIFSPRPTSENSTSNLGMSRSTGSNVVGRRQAVTTLRFVTCCSCVISYQSTNVQQKNHSRSKFNPHAFQQTSTTPALTQPYPVSTYSSPVPISPSSFPPSSHVSHR